MTYQTIVSANVLVENLENPDWVILDCRDSLMEKEYGPKAYAKGHIPKACYCSLSGDFSSLVTADSGRHPFPDISLLIEKLGRWGIGENTQVVLYDDMNGAFASRMWWQIRSLGHRNVALLDGGLKYWLKQNLPITDQVYSPGAQEFKGNFDDHQIITIEEVEANIKDSTFSLLDARAAARYRGEVEPIDPIAGHIPNALNRDFTNNLDEKGLFLTADQLKDQFQPLVDSAENNQIVHMCGSGVTACHNMLAMEIAGLTGSKLFVGSWSEWITDTNREISTG